MDDWRKQYVFKFRKEYIQKEEIKTLLENYLKGLNKLFREYEIDEEICLEDNVITLPDCKVNFKISDDKTKIEFTKFELDNPSSLINSLSLCFREGFYHIQLGINFKNAQQENTKFEVIGMNTIDYILNKLLVK